MKNLAYFILLLLLLLIKLNYGNVDKNLGSLSDILLSNFTIFNYNKIENLIVFGDSHSAVNTNFTDMSYTGKVKLIKILKI